MKNENPVVWFEIYVDDMQRAKKFYEEVLETTLNELPNPTDDGAQMFAFPMDMKSENRASGSLVKMEGFKAGNNSTIVYFMSEDCAIEESRVEKAGGSIFKPKMSIGEYGAMVLARDTEGNMIGFHSMQ
ncbi:MAG: VOC family protein [Cyclobacteriaceae bacterium]